jgi:hypothetical protein
MPERPVHVSAPEGLREPRGRGVAGHRLGGTVRVALLRGLPLVAACDAWCQLGTRLELDALIAAGDALIGWPRPMATEQDVDAAIQRFGSRPGAVRLRRARSWMRPGSASPRETRLRLLVERTGHPAPECNGVIPLLDGDSTHGDLVFREQRVILEYDGEQHRTDEKQFHRDVDRLNALALAGWTVIRVTRAQSPARMLQSLDRALG